MVNPLEELPKELVMPKIVDETGNQITPPPVPATLPLVVQLAQLGQLVKIRNSLEKAEFKGEEVPVTLSVTDKIQRLETHLPVPWICAFFTNDGPDTARIAINHPYDDKQFELRLDETRTIDHAHADERISTIYYVCNPGETALVRVTGQY